MKFAICQELFENWDWERQCRFIAETGYTGIELAPFTLASRISDVSPERRRELRSQAEDHGLTICGLHWLLAKTEGFHLTTNDASIRQATTKYLIELGQACADLGGIVMEPLTTRETDFVNTCAEAVELIDLVGHPNIVLHQDVKAMLSESTPIPELIARYASITGHFHVNDDNLLGPGMGRTDYHPIVKALLETGYSGWVSVEVFDYKPGAEYIAKTSIEYMRRILDEVRAN